MTKFILPAALVLASIAGAAAQEETGGARRDLEHRLYKDLVRHEETVAEIERKGTERLVQLLRREPEALSAKDADRQVNEILRVAGGELAAEEKVLVEMTKRHDELRAPAGPQGTSHQLELCAELIARGRDNLTQAEERLYRLARQARNKFIKTADGLPYGVLPRPSPQTFERF